MTQFLSDHIAQVNRSNMLTDISREEFREKFLLGRQVAHEGVRSFEARDSGDRMVMVHLLGPVDGAEAVPWLAALSAMAPERRTGLIGAFKMDGDAVLVTEFLPQVRSLADWFVAASSGQDATEETPVPQPDELPAADPSVVKPEDTDEGMGEFTRMFVPDKQSPAAVPLEEAETEEIPRVEESADVDMQAPEIEQPPVVQAGEGQGEFTSMFGGQPDGIPAPSPKQAEEPKPAATFDEQVPPSKEPEVQGGEFTQFFGAQEEKAPEPQPSPTPIQQPSPASPPPRVDPPKPPGGEGKAGPRIVWRDKKSRQAPQESGQPKISVRKAKEPPPPSPVKEQPPGQFTEIFGHELSQGSKPQRPAPVEPPPIDTGPRPSASDHPAPLSGPTSDNYLKALGSDSQVKPPPAPSSPKPEIGRQAQSPDLPPPITSPRPDPAPGPSDYTRVVSGHPVVPPPTAAPAPAPVPAPAPAQPKAAEDAGPAKVPTWLWVVLASIVLIMVLLVVLVVLT